VSSLRREKKAKRRSESPGQVGGGGGESWHRGLLSPKEAERGKEPLGEELGDLSSRGSLNRQVRGGGDTVRAVAKR